VVEVDRERGRIGLRLADDPDVAGKSPEELATVGSGDNGPSARGRERGGRDGRERGRDRDRDRGVRDRAPRDGDRSSSREPGGRVRDRDPERPRY
jgi:polyribonucleotide nucleotidyltransferase